MKHVIALIGAILLLLALTACGPGPQVEPDETTVPASAPEETASQESIPKEAVQPPEEEVVRLYSFRLYNSTDHTITALSLREAGESAYTVNLLSQELKDGENADISYNAAPALRAFEEAQVQGTEDTPLLTPEYRLLVLLEDGSWHELAAFPLEDTDEGTLLFEDGVVYLSYESFSTGHLISTRDAQRWILAWGNPEEPDFSALTGPGKTAPAKEEAPSVEGSPSEETTPAEEDAPQGAKEAGEAPDGKENAAPGSTDPENANPEDKDPEEDEEYDPDAGCLTGGLFH